MLTVYKPQGLTPLQTIHLLQEKYPEYREQTISYAGRLDPMAEGLLILLVNEENKKRHDYEAMTKTYEFELLLGVATDTYDLLGLITSQSPLSPTSSLSKQITLLLPEFVGTYSQPYPPYSSKPVNGKPLYWWAREGKLHEITIPTKQVTISSLTSLSSRSLSAQKLEEDIIMRIMRVSGDFRQEAILSSWKNFFLSSPSPVYEIYKFQIICSSGTYVRSIANTLGEKLGCGALAYSIKRTGVGDYSLQDSTPIDPIAG